MEARRDDQDGLGRVLTPPLYGPPERLEDARAKVADREGVAQAHMDGEDQREMMKPGGRSPDRENGEVFAKVNVHHIGPQGEDGGDDRRVVSTVWTTPRRSSARVSSAVWFCIPPMGSNFTPLPTSAEGGGSNTEQSLSTPSRVRSLPLISQEPPEEPLAANADRTPLHTTLIVPSRAAGEMRG